jgi:tetratricopeptide (TPR) repeat protein
MKLSLCIAAKDGAHLARCLASADGLVDEIIIADMGLPEEARKAMSGATIVEVDGDDIVAARNAALKKASGDWTLVLEEDESLRADAAARIRPLLDTVKHDAFRFAVPKGRHDVRLFRSRIGIAFGKDGTPAKSLKDAFAKMADSGAAVSSAEDALKAEKAGELFREGSRRLKAGEVDAAIEALTQANRLEPRNIETTSMLGVAYAKKGQPAKALRCFTTALKVPPKQALVYMDSYPYANLFANIGTLLGAQGKGAKAIVAYEKAIKLGHPDADGLRLRVERLRKAADEKTTFSYSLSLGVE